jgi:hypothetical protein
MNGNKEIQRFAGPVGMYRLAAWGISASFPRLAAKR